MASRVAIELCASGCARKVLAKFQVNALTEQLRMAGRKSGKTPCRHAQSKFWNVWFWYGWKALHPLKQTGDPEIYRPNNLEKG